MNRTDSLQTPPSSAGEMLQVGFVACNIVGHSAVKSLDTQLERISGINNIIRSAIAECGQENVHWASGGDGGYVVFSQADWQEPAVRLMAQLTQWADKADCPLRVIGHRGAVEYIEGADGRTQFVGDGINLASRILLYGFPGGVVVSEPFRNGIEQSGLSGVRFHAPRLIHPRHFSAQKLFLMSAADEFNSTWGVSFQRDRDFLSANPRKNGWDVVYHAKRLMQVNASDRLARRALSRLKPHSLTFEKAPGDREPNPFLGHLNRRSLVEFIRAAQLVERQADEVLCREGDEGDSMFVVLRGEVGIILGEGDEKKVGRPDEVPRSVFSAKSGEIIGELAFALKSKRTATLTALEPTALLSFNHDQILSLVEQQANSRASIGQNVDRFMTSRILEHICNSLPYLVGPGGSGPLGQESDFDKPWEIMLDQSRLCPFSLKDSPTISLENEPFQTSGLYLLVSGRLRSVANPDKLLEDTDYPIVFVDLPNRLVTPNYRYAVEKDALILRIDAGAFLEFESETFLNVVAEIKRELPKLFFYEVFISYTSADESFADQLKQKLEAAGLRVYMDVARLMHHFPEKIAGAIVDSLVFVPLISAHTMTRPNEENWVKREIDFRQQSFECLSANILPVRLKGGTVERFADGFTSIDAQVGVDTVAAAIIEQVRDVKDSRIEPPYALSRKTGIKLHD